MIGEAGGSIRRGPTFFGPFGPGSKQIKISLGSSPNSSAKPEIFPDERRASQTFAQLEFSGLEVLISFSRHLIKLRGIKRLIDLFLDAMGGWKMDDSALKGVHVVAKAKAFMSSELMTPKI